MSRTIQQVRAENALLYCDFRTQFDYQGKRSVENYGKYPGAPRVVTLSDGTTSTKFPSQLVGRHGASFDGGDYAIADGLLAPFDTSSQFTLFVAFSGMNKTTQRTLLTTRASIANNGTHWNWYYYNGYWYVDLANTWSTNHLQVRATATTDSGFGTACFTYSGGAALASCAHYVSGAPNTLTAVNNNLSATIKGSTYISIGAFNDGAVPLIGNIHHASVWPYVFTPQQVAYLDQQCRRGINRA